tara:strand:+ start:2759 stop:3487 length:729 start_codon:yes stop_codon:yes gene_type:complete
MNNKKQNHDICENILSKINKSIEDKNSEQKKRTYLGASSLGDSCSRKIQYRYMGHKADEGSGFNGKVLRIFEFGHAIEDMAHGWIFNAGFDLKSTDKNGDQFGFSIADGEVKGHIDGVICGGPVEMQYPMLWECKSANEKSFNEFVRKGVSATNQTYAAQIALYQAYMDLTDNPALFTVINKNTCEIYFELVPFNKALAQKVSDKAVDILNAVKHNELLPRIAVNSDYFVCRFCEFRKSCWE